MYTLKLNLQFSHKYDTGNITKRYFYTCKELGSINDLYAIHYEQGHNKYFCFYEGNKENTEELSHALTFKEAKTNINNHFNKYYN